MAFRYESDNIRYKKITDALNNISATHDTDFSENNLDEAEDLTIVYAVKNPNGDVDVNYAELWNENCLSALFQKVEYKELANKPLQAIQKFYKERFLNIAKEANLEIIDYDIYPTDFVGEAILRVEMVLNNDDFENSKIVSEVDFAVNTPNNDPRFTMNPKSELKPQMDTKQEALPQGGVSQVQVKPENRFNQVYMTRNKPQDPKAVDILLKTVFDDKFDPKYGLSTDIGEWNPVKTLRTQEGKFLIQWDHVETNKVHITTIFFQNDSNKIDVNVTSTSGEAIITTSFEVYRIPTDNFLVERFFRKVYFSIMKKFINTQIIKIEPFRRSFVFWKSNNPYFSYSFSEPRKNQIILDLIGFIKVNQKPILDDFFEQNNLKHKQGYLQTLLDAAEDAGIFEFKRTGNEVLITKGVNFKAFLEGRIRKYS